MSQKTEETSVQTHWSRLAERGSGLGLRFVFVCQRFLGRRTAASSS